MPLIVHMFPCLSDNYGFIIRDEVSGQVATIDTPEATRIAAEIEAVGWGRLDYILNTHWHPDHTGGNAALKDRYDARILGPQEVRRVAPLDEVVHTGDVFMLGETRLDVIDLSGHTAEQIGYHDATGQRIFVADALFSLGCGRLSGGTAEQSWHSLKRLSALPPDTLIYCAHEYTLANLAFAMSVAELLTLAGPELEQRAGIMHDLRAKGQPTVPMRIGDEIVTNPFLCLPLQETDVAAQVHRFAELRAAKDVFKG